ncbi:hypothetical protein MAQ5080_03457 [Marinomonas aquimarina]|uniref:HNH endonuclease n=1 Tax=Marinomonas aquimarina TaxID=295068 RepID=A0A1A8TT01_9GAMM|nr:hypothetical protein [Marinomonas aquimarina]SBS36469.1 hypothetical protein MAQ5080_03457 [Marinomonas aquimarina]
MSQVKLLFQKYSSPQCILCGEQGILTREHKFKHAVLKNSFGDEKLRLGSKESFFEGKSKSIQSTSAKSLKFNTQICLPCNSSRTQPGDRQFDKLIEFLIDAEKEGLSPNSVFETKDFQVGSEGRINLLRYFAKLLCNFLSDANYPVPLRLSEFAICRSDDNCLKIGVEKMLIMHN